MELGAWLCGLADRRSGTEEDDEVAGLLKRFDHLAATTETVAAITAAVGYRDTSAFIHAFRAHHGTTPARWRQRERLDE